MPSDAYYEELWRSFPPRAEPAHARRRLRFLLERTAAVQAPSRPVRVLDLGCGEGYFALALARVGAEVVAADVAAEALRRVPPAPPDAPPGGSIELCQLALGGELPFADSCFDVVWAGEVIEHVADTAAWLSEVRRVLRSGGSLLLSTPDHGPLLLAAMALRGRLFDRRFDPRSDHLHFYTRRTLAALLTDFGFDEVVVERDGGLPGARAGLLAGACRRRF